MQDQSSKRGHHLEYLLGFYGRKNPQLAVEIELGLKAGEFTSLEIPRARFIRWRMLRQSRAANAQTALGAANRQARAAEHTAYAAYAALVVSICSLVVAYLAYTKPLDQPPIAATTSAKLPAPSAHPEINAPMKGVSRAALPAPTASAPHSGHP